MTLGKSHGLIYKQTGMEKQFSCQYETLSELLQVPLTAAGYNFQNSMLVFGKNIFNLKASIPIL